MYENGGVQIFQDPQFGLPGAHFATTRHTASSNINRFLQF